MATATFTSTEGEAEQQFVDAPGEETEDSQDWPNWKEGASKSESKTGDQPKQVEGGAEAPPEDNPHPQNRDLRKNPKNQKKKPRPFSLIM